MKNSLDSLLYIKRVKFSQVQMCQKTEQHSDMKNVDRKVLFIMFMPEQILQLLMVQKFTVKVIW